MKTGDIGEDIALKYLLYRGFELVCRNYRRPWGEIDIIVKKGSKLIFVEVKTVESLKNDWDKVREFKRPEERVTDKKLARLRKTVQTFLIETKNNDSGWFFGVCGVFLDPVSKKAKVSFLIEPL